MVTFAPMFRMLLGALGAFFMLPAVAGEFVPGGNSGVLARSFALPALGDADVLPAGRGQSRYVFDLTNEHVREGICGTDPDCIVLDGETARLQWRVRRGLGRGWDMTIDVPVLYQSGGFLDGWIQDWHGWFGLPNGGREQVADDQHRYYYQRGATTLLDVAKTDYGLGDISVGFGRQLGAAGALRSLVKIPTGDAEELNGGNTGGALWLDLALPVPAGWDGYLAGGYSFNERGDVLTELQNERVGFGGIGILAPFIGGTRLLLQVQGHTALFEGSNLTPLARQALPLSVGLQFRGRRGGAFDIGFLEDLSVNGSPDFVFYVALTSR